jgi:fumarate reductase subunit D
MDWKKKKRLIWICFGVFSAVTMFGAIIHPVVLFIGMFGLAGIMGYCMIKT